MASKAKNDAGAYCAITGRMAIEWQSCASTAWPRAKGGQRASVSALFIEAANALSADAGVANSNAASSTSNLNIFASNPFRQVKQPGSRFSS
jgi:hypothetical protein